jgi:hypothetical protein
MAEPFLSEVRIMSFEFAPKGWALCNGQLLPINQNQALFSLLGTTFGGDGRVNFALPDLRGRAPIHVGSGHTLGERRRRAGAYAQYRRAADPHPCAERFLVRWNAIGPRREPVGEGGTGKSLPGTEQPGSNEFSVGAQRRRFPGTPQHAAVSGTEFLHCAAGHFPVAELRR